MILLYRQKVTMAVLSLTLVILATVMQSSLCEVYSSVEDMKSVFNLERNIVMELLNLAEKMKSKLNKIQRSVNIVIVIDFRYQTFDKHHKLIGLSVVTF